MARVLLAVFLSIVALAVACGDDDDDAPAGSGSPSPVRSETPTLAPGETPAPTGQPTPTASSGETTYMVVAGDTLYSIAQRFGTTVDAIAHANGIVDPTQIEVGQVLIIPGGFSTPIPTTPPPATETPHQTGAAQVIRYGDTSRKVIAFTFDAGSDAGYTAQILDTLGANSIHATFGMTGKFAETYPDLVKRMVNEGHTLMNHSYDHKSFTGNSTQSNGLTEGERWDELNRTEQIVQDLTGATTKPFFRPPFGDYDESVNEDVGALGYEYNVMWALDSRGWTGIPAAQITSRCLEMSEPGAIYIFHVGSASQDGPALQSIIDGLEAQGYEITDVPGVLE
jgi:peptidoglycan/xylan/chitin deacetylase (PgdA/CDA1 family)